MMDEKDERIRSLMLDIDDRKQEYRKIFDELQQSAPIINQLKRYCTVRLYKNCIFSNR